MEEGEENGVMNLFKWIYGTRQFSKELQRQQEVSVAGLVSQESLNRQNAKSKALVISFHTSSAPRSVQAICLRMQTQNISEGMDREAGSPLWCLQWSRDLTATCKGLKLSRAIRIVQGHPRGLIWNKSRKTRDLSVMSSQMLVEESLKGSDRITSLEHLKPGKEGRQEGSLGIKPQELSSISRQLDSWVGDLLGENSHL